MGAVTTQKGETSELALSRNSRAAYNEIVRHYGCNDPIEHCSIGLFDVLRAHFLICDFFIEIGSGLFQPGPRDLGLLESAVSRQQAYYFGSAKWKNDTEKIASLFFGLVMDHPFHDANKRTAFLVALYAMYKCGHTPTITDKEFEDFTVTIAEGNYREKARFKSFRQSMNDADAAVMYIADFFHRNFRNIDKRRYIVTYKELNELIKAFGYELAEQDHNFINLMRREERRKLWGFGSRESVNIRVRQIAFPGWSREVPRNTVDEVRKAMKATYKDGVDSAAFFQGADPAGALISRYQRALESLAYR